MVITLVGLQEHTLHKIHDFLSICDRVQTIIPIREDLKLNTPCRTIHDLSLLTNDNQHSFKLVVFNA